jgi:hypothetical protein
MEQQQPQAQTQQPAQPVKQEKKGEEEFSLAWNLKVLAVIYVILFAFYLVLKFTLK